MSLTSLKATHTRYRNIVEREIKIANDILHEDISLEERDVKRLLKKAKLCEKRLSEFSEKLDSTKDALTNILESEKGFEDIERIVEEDCSLFSEVTDLLFELTEFVADVKSKIEEVSVKEKPPKDIDLKYMFDLQTEIQKQMKDLIVIQQENIKHQKETFEAKRDERTDVPSMRLPMLELKHYDGDRLKWLEFWDSFHSTIHTNKRLSNIEKFNYLTSILRGEAKGVIDGLSLSNDNYFVALKLLSERFGETQNVIDTNYTQLINLKPATTKTESLRVLYGLFEKNLRSLETLEQDVNQAVFISMLTSKLPIEVLTQLELQKGAKNKWSVKKLRDLLHDYICAKERAEQQASSDKEAQRPQTFNQQSGQASASGNSFMNNHGTNKFHQETRQLKMSTEALFTGQNETSGGYNGTKSYKDLCRYCEGRHWSDECKKYKTVDERKKQIRGSCYLCLKSGHNAGDCKSGKTCVHCKRQNHHHRSLCPSKFLRESREIAHVAEEICTQKELKSENMLVSTEEIVLMQTAKTELKNPDLDMTDTARILLDSGSQRTYITESMANKLKLQLGDIHEIRLVTFGEERAKIIKTPTAHVDIKLNDGTYMTMTVNVVPKIAGEIVRRPVSVTNNDGLNHLFGSIVLADTLPAESETSSIELLIGNDYYLDVVLPQRMEIQPGLYLLSSRFGWILTGRTSDDRDTVQHSMLILTYGQDVQRETTLYSDLDKSVTTNPNLKDFWNLENIGINDPLKDKGDDEALIKFNNSVRYENERYFVSWPWKDENSSLPVNYELAFGRLRTLLHKLKKNPDLMKQYDQIIQEQKSQGIIEQVPTNSNTERLHYIPHHAVLRPTKTTTKVRIVFDASAKTKSSNNSLNDCLYRGPVMLRDLSGLLIRFRMNEIALTADIEKAFLQVGLLPTDQDVTRFLWVKDTKLQPVKDNLQEYRFRRIPFGIVSSPFLLAATLKYHMDKDQSKTTERLQNDIYVDNLITGVKSVVEAVDTYRESRKIFDNASMNLREWMSNSQEVMNSIPVSDHAKNKNMKVLGMFWNSTEDKISLQSNVKQNGKMDTKREILGQIASVFDPLGLFNPVVLKGKLLLQELWEKGMDWDEKLESDQRERWNEIKHDLSRLNEIKIPRYIGMSGDVQYELLSFCDASQYAYATAVYIYQKQGSTFKSDLVYAKSRVAPKSGLSIPRMELLAVVIGARCVDFVKKQINIPVKRIHLFTDSQCVIQWINTKKPLSTFIQNRIKEIKQHNNITFYHVKSKDNAADVASRGTNADILADDKQWWHGPDWLTQQPVKWSVSNGLKNHSTETGDEIITTNPVVQSEEHTEIEYSDCSLLTVKEKIDPPGNIQIERFSSLTKLLRVTALVLRFVRKLRKGLNLNSNQQTSAKELKDAENLWIRYVQKKHYSEVISDMKSGKPNSTTKQLGLYMDDQGLLRCQGRLDNAELCEATKHPLLLKKYDKFTKLIIERTHKQLLHAGISQTLSQIRLQYWIPQGRAALKSVLNQCGICRRYEGGPFKMPSMPQLPKQRVTKSTPFSCTGLDYLGPLYVKTPSETHFNTKKVWVCLFTCMVTRAIHLEVIQNMSAEQFLLGFRRFIARRGTPCNVLSDNASQFKVSSVVVDKIWGEVLDDADVITYIANLGIEWKFIVEKAPWMGGAYERLVGLVKRCLRKAIGKVCLTNEQLLTYISEVEAVVNSRPIVYVGEDINSSLTLTPAHFLTLNPKLGIPECDINDDQDYDPFESSAKTLLLSWKKGQRLLDQFWKLWKRDYLLSLRERFKNKLKAPRKQSCYTPNIGDVVLIHDDMPRGTWRMGKICDLIPSYDGQIRSAKVLVSSGNIFGRSLNMLYPIECPEVTPTADKQEKDVNDTNPKVCESIKAEGSQKAKVGRSGDIGWSGEVGRSGDVSRGGDVGRGGEVGQTSDVSRGGDVGRGGEVGQVGDVGRSGEADNQMGRPQRKTAQEFKNKLKHLILSDSV